MAGHAACLARRFRMTAFLVSNSQSMRLGNAGAGTSSASTGLACWCGGRDGDALGHAIAGTAGGQRQRVIDTGRDAAGGADSHRIWQVVAARHGSAGGGSGGSETEGGIGQSDIGDGRDSASSRGDDSYRERIAAS